MNELDELERVSGMMSIIRMFNYDMVKIRAFIIEREDGDVDDVIRAYEILCDQIKPSVSGSDVIIKSQKNE